jgi:RNA polymerase sigma factor (sigma-70 family)
MDTAERDRLVGETMPTIRRIANRFYCQNASLLDDLVQEGALGAMEAAERYDPQAGVRFGNYAAHRIYGRMRDFLRDWDHLSRVHRARVNAGKDRPVEVQSMDVSLCERGERILHLHEMIGQRDHELVELRDEVARLLRHLSARERRIVTGYFLEQKTMREVAGELDLTESRVSQCVALIVRKLRDKFGRGGTIRFNRGAKHESPAKRARRRAMSQFGGSPRDLDDRADGVLAGSGSLERGEPATADVA